ncbi:unnamed protein product [Prunus armeniaca]|uniref:Uncharacterized protein n=1 Tax=Prunus armeniaca TaxID=36596 RepID=A0A6J5UAI2_PRUAR|nr:unnamed protein product [Prunus armeniaca]CAB4303929.1 unnamed protein product [Prunus armeniaca]
MPTCQRFTKPSSKASPVTKQTHNTTLAEWQGLSKGKDGLEVYLLAVLAKSDLMKPELVRAALTEPTLVPRGILLNWCCTKGLDTKNPLKNLPLPNETKTSQAPNPCRTQKGLRKFFNSPHLLQHGEYRLASLGSKVIGHSRVQNLAKKSLAEMPS